MEATMKNDHPWIRQWMEVRWQRDLGITDADIRLMRKSAEVEEDEDRSDAEEYEDDDREVEKKKEAKAKADDDQDDADEAEERDRLNDMYVMRGYSIPRRFDAGDAGLRRVALHEAGHCVVAIAHGRRIRSVTVVAGSDYAGKMSEEETPEMMKALLDFLSGGRAPAEVEACARKHVVGYMAGTVSEWLMCPRESWTSDRHRTASSDLKLARLFATAIAGDDSEALLSAAREEARDILAANRHLVSAIADALIERGTLTGAEIEIILKDREP
jgi:hypothetical protein